ncbi:hypothetical protein R3Q06_28020 [Rhodococcus erythropolis]|uniref:hypothetical protein n=1 Tax=Rhodococcus erythropolis TaxID=1833 RepID=UPI0029492B4D|nr:hypothetical protein [Rhodococcus erythropolis]MDV6277349.1 hypothetical protein [Rhodococcus erythropolis]
MTNPNISASSPRKKMVRALLVAPIAVGALAGALAAGAGISAAATTGSAAPDMPGTSQTSTYQWSLTNMTDERISIGRWSVSETGTPNSSYVEAAYLQPWHPGATVSATQDYTGKALTWQASICYRGQLWGHGYSAPPAMDTKSPTSFGLTVSSRNELYVSYAGQNYKMGATGSPCEW